MNQGLKDVELERHYQTLFDLFVSPAWKAFLSEVVRFREPRENIRHLANGDALMYRQGELSALDWVEAFEEMNTKAYHQMVADEQEDAMARASNAAWVDEQTGRAKVVT